MSVVAGFGKGLGVAAMIVGLVALIAGIVVGLSGASDFERCQENEDRFFSGERCTDEDAEVAEAKVYGGGASAGAGIILLVLGSLFYFVARGAERRMDRKASRQQAPIPKLDE